MLDARLIEKNPSLLKKTLIARGMQAELRNIDIFLEKRREWKQLKKQIDELRHKKNTISLAINEAIKKGKKEEAEEKRTEAKKIVEEIKETEGKVSRLEKETKEIALIFPNLVEDLPKKEKIISTYGKTKKQRWQKSYLEICSQLGLIDFDSAVKMSGEGFYSFTGLGARLQRALINFFLSCAEKNGYAEQFPPILVSEKAMVNSGQLPKFKEGMYHMQNNLYLVPTAEVSLLNLYAGKILKGKELPIYITAYSPCFRVEEGATKALFRVHQFDKVELFKFVKQKDSDKELEKMVKDASQILKLLKIPHRVKLLPAGEIGIASAKTYDIDVFSPVSRWLEVSSCSNCTDYQSRRARIFYLDKEKKLVHTLNGSGLGLPRTFIALIENYQQKDGSIKVPKVLQKYTGFKKIEPETKAKLKKK